MWIDTYPKKTDGLQTYGATVAEPQGSVKQSHLQLSFSTHEDDLFEKYSKQRTVEGAEREEFMLLGMSVSVASLENGMESYSEKKNRNCVIPRHLTVGI